VSCDVFGVQETPVPVAGDATEEAVAPTEATGVEGFFSQMFGSPAVATEEPVPTQEAALPIVPEDEGGGFWSFLGGFEGGPSGPAAAGVQVPPNGIVPYGQLATVCGLSTRNLGRVVERASGYAVHDSNPTTTAPRTHYVTGFSDGCARQFTAALALFGDIGTHEIVRYGAADGGLPYSETDNAYEEIKAAFCGVRAGRPCGARIDRLARRTTFLTIYRGFGANQTWVDVLLHDGDVAAIDSL